MTAPAPSSASLGSTAVEDVLSRPQTGLRAVVVGSGVAGLVAARVLSEHFDEVLLLERDSLPTEAAEGGLAATKDAVSARRRGVPQWGQPHVMLNRGLQELEALFPGLKEDLIAGGAPSVAAPASWTMYDGRLGGLMPHKYTAFEILCASRPLVETELRVRLARDRPNVTSVLGAVVEGLEFGGGPDAAARPGRVTGVRLRGCLAPLGADLVVDASGRGSRAPEWLAAAGWEAPPTVTVDANLVYTSTVIKLPDDWAASGGDEVIFCVAVPPDTRSGLIVPIEGGVHHLIMAGRADQRCPPNDEAIAEFASSLPHPALAKALAAGRRVGEIRCYERTANFRRRYEDIEMPGNLVVFGDAACAFNPVHGQGMTVAVLEAVELGRQLGAALPPPAAAAATAAADRAAPPPPRLAAARAALPAASRGFMRSLGRQVAVPWSLATGADQAYAPGFKQTMAEKAISGLFDEITRLSLRDVAVHERLMRVMHMLEEPSSLMSPGILLRLAADKLAGLFGRGGGSRASA
ncbi:2-polyprenyl-6-methoxyphenol hydroxylase-like oxidoreductase [Raphidocelis subcapitata]|uniref:2-polyprenyl-6-methoxyphenol hydroxylase-like oxidoreductase n=1 Tax=Raphidocelis subcapitata TaxID=307507 RepID=A0A2V0NVD1_9CHLO|nr:2-polyprenyl-6-methoxyphenol hydroxylase-like oxidoreductase [Raphidocelis subcapitata]|eukprot:GBF91594.1 2-polyprenyl-6-methoxyphenol hydroxylase-like oxidoreductase [Raphidocelis subcapitata]